MAALPLLAIPGCRAPDSQMPTILKRKKHESYRIEKIEDFIGLILQKEIMIS